VISELRFMDGAGDPGTVLRYNNGTDSYDVVSGDGGELVFL